MSCLFSILEIGQEVHFDKIEGAINGCPHSFNVSDITAIYEGHVVPGADRFRFFKSYKCGKCNDSQIPITFFEVSCRGDDIVKAFFAQVKELEVIELDKKK